MRDFSNIDAIVRRMDKTADHAGPSVETLIRRARELKLEGNDVIDKFTPEEIEKYYNGIGNAGMPDWIRNALTRNWSYYTPAAFIHDLEFAKGGTKKDWEKANENLYRNLGKLVEENPNSGPIRHAYQTRMNLLAKKLMDKYSLKAFNLKDPERDDGDGSEKPEKVASARDFSGLESHVNSFVKEAAVSWYPWNWGKDATKESVGYDANWGDFFHHAGDNMKSAPARVGQIMSHGGTDMAAGMAHLVGAHGVGNRINQWQNNMDATYDSMMSPEMRAEYQENKFGRAAGEVGSMAVGALIPMPGGGLMKAVGKPLGRVAPRMARMIQPAVDFTGAAVSKPGMYARTANAMAGAAAKGVQGVGRLVTRLPGNVANVAGSAMQAVTPNMMSNLASAANVAASVRGSAPELRRGTDAASGSDYDGNRNPVTQSKDWINEKLRGQRYMAGNKVMAPGDENYQDWERWFDKRYRPEGEVPEELPMLRNGKQVYDSDRSGALTTPWTVGNKNLQRRINRWMDMENEHASANEVGALASSSFGKAFGYPQGNYHTVPSLTVENGKLKIDPRPMINEGRRDGRIYGADSFWAQRGADLDERLGRTDSRYERLGAGASVPLRLGAYSMLPTAAPLADVVNGATSDNWGEAGMGAGMLGAQYIPGISKVVGRHPLIGGAAMMLGGGYLGDKAQEIAGKYAPGLVPEKSEYPERVYRAAQEMLNAENGVATPGYFSNTKD